jgi:hypothetical protein
MIRPARAVAVLLAGVIALTSVACGIPTDDEPRAIPPSAFDGSTSTTTEVGSEDPDNVMVPETIYLVEGNATFSPTGDRLSPIMVNITNTTDTAQLVKLTLEELIRTKSDKGLTNAVPSGTRILSAKLNAEGTELDLDLSDEFNGIQQELQRQAFAQVVFTATGVTPSRIQGVRFLIGGQLVVASTSTDNTPAVGQVITRSDYPALLASVQSATTELGAN